MTTARDPYAPRWQLFVNGDLMPEEISQFIKSVVVEDDAEMFDKITLTIGALQFTERGNVRNVLESKIFSAPGQLLRVDMGYGNSLQTVGAGEIVKVKPRFGREGIEIEVIAYDPFFRLSKSKSTKSRSFADQKISQIFKTVIEAIPNGRMTFINEIPPEKDIVPNPAIVQPVGMNDYKFLKDIANSKGLDFFNEFVPKSGDKGKFNVAASEPNDKSQAQYVFTYFEHNDDPLTTLYDFFPELNVTAQVTDVKFAAHNRKEKKKIESFVTSPNEEGTETTKFKGPEKAKPFKGGESTVVTFKSFGQIFELITDRGFNNAKEAKLYAEACMKDLQNQFITGPATLVGVEAVKARIVVEFKGLVETYNGNYYVNRVTHSMVDGQVYISKVDVRKIVNFVAV